MDIDELDVNPFYLALQTSQFKLFEKAQKECCVICVPQKKSLLSDKFSTKFLETHILKPSPFFTGQYVSISSNHSKTVTLDGSLLITGEGFDMEVKVRILSEEIGYNKEYKPFRILIIDKPLDPDYQAVPGSKTTREEYFTVSGGFEQWRKFLNSYPGYKDVLHSLDTSLLKFNTNYMVLTDYLHDAARRLENLYSQAMENCLQETKPKELSEPRFSDHLSVSVQGFILRKVHQKVFSAICERYSSEDNQLFKKCLHLQNVGNDQLGVRQIFSCPLPAAVVEVANLDQLKTPFEKLKCIKSTLDQIAEGVTSFVEENQQSCVSDNDIPCLASDDLIPILVSVLAQAKCAHLQTNVFYMENFFWSNSSKNEISFGLVTLKAAVQYMMITDFTSLQLSKPSHKKEVSIEELIDVTERIGQTDRGDNLSASPGAPLSRIDRQLLRISKMLEDSSLEWSKSANKPVNQSVFQTATSLEASSLGATADPNLSRNQRASPRPNKDQLGDFLSSLQEDVFDSSFGKQT